MASEATNQWYTADIVAVGSNAIGVVAAGAFNAIGIVALGLLNALGLVSVSPLNSVAFVAIGGSTPWGLSPLAASTR